MEERRAKRNSVGWSKPATEGPSTSEYHDSARGLAAHDVQHLTVWQCCGCDKETHLRVIALTLMLAVVGLLFVYLGRKDITIYGRIILWWAFATLFISAVGYTCLKCRDVQSEKDDPALKKKHVAPW